MKWYRLAAEQGLADAQYNLGVMYEVGQGVPQDYDEAVKWYRLAAEQGDALGQNNLGFMYANGQGVPQDYVLAYMWMNLAAASLTGEDLNDAVKVRDHLASKLTPDQLAKAQEMSRNWKPKAAE